MGIRGELFTTQVMVENRSYFFNVKENRTGDIFLQIVESKNKEGTQFDRHAIVLFADDMQRFFKGLDASVSFIEKEKKERKKKALEKKIARSEKYSRSEKPAGDKVGVVNIPSRRKKTKSGDEE